MRILPLLTAVVLAAGCGGGRTTFARYPNSSVTFDRTTQDAKALAIADKVLAAAGGDAAWAKAKQLKWSQSIMKDGKEVLGGSQAWDRWNGRHNGRAHRQDGDLVVIREIYGETENAYLDRGQGHLMKKIEGGADQAIKMAHERWEFDTTILFMPFLLEEPGTKLEYVEEAQSDDGKPADILRVTFDPKDKTRTATYRILVNRETNQIVRYEIQKAGAGEDQRLGYGVTQWLEGSGIKYPGTIENLGLKGEVLTYKDLATGDVDENLYIPPPLM
jgi:hypothetical protein